MKLATGLRAGMRSMKYGSPKQYAATKDAHNVINTAAVNQFTKVYYPLNNRDRVLDFGCATGETANAIARGELGNLGRPESVIGTDMEKVLIDHCKTTYNTPNVNWRQLEVESNDCRQFCYENDGKLDLVTSFSYLQWVENQPMAVEMFNKVLNTGGKFCFVIPSTQNQQRNNMRKEFENMKKEDKWSKMLSKTSWPNFKTIHKNNDWMSTVDNKGNGPIIEEDYVRLMENHGFKVEFSHSQPLQYVFNDEFIRNFFKSTILTSFNELNENERKEFMEEFVRRLKNQKQLNSDGHYEAHVDGFLIMGEKQRDVM